MTWPWPSRPPAEPPRRSRCTRRHSALETKLGLDHPNTLGSRHNLAFTYLAAGRTTDALAVQEGTVKLWEAKLGPDHANTLASRHNLAVAYQAIGRTAEAIPLYEATLKVQETKLGPDHPDSLASLNNLAAAYESLNRWSDAEVLRRDAMTRRRRSEKPDSPLLAFDMAALGGLLLSQSRRAEAEPLLRESLAILIKPQSDYWRRYHVMSLLGGVLMGEGRFAEAEPLVVSGYEGMKAREAKISYRARPSLGEAAERVIRLYDQWNKPAQAQVWKAKLGMLDLPADVFARP